MMLLLIRLYQIPNTIPQSSLEDSELYLVAYLNSDIVSISCQVHFVTSLKPK